MYFVYKNNMQMYLTKEEIVIKTWNKIYKIVADEQMFEAIKKVVGFVRSPKMYEEILEYFSTEREMNLNKTISILLKSNVIMMNENLGRLNNPLLYQYDDIEKIMDKLEKEKIRGINTSLEILEKIQMAGMKIVTEGEGDYLLIWNENGLEQLEEMFDTYSPKHKKMILAGIHKGYIYSIFCNEESNDIRKAYYRIRNNETEDEMTEYQKHIAKKILENQCLEYFYAEKEKYNFTLIARDLSVRNEKLNYCTIYKKVEKKNVIIDQLKDKEEETDYPEIDTYINNLPFVGYFGSKGCNQMPLPRQTLWLIDTKGELQVKIYAQGDTCERAMLRSIRYALSYLNEDKNELISVNESKEDYYFEAIAEILFMVDEKKWNIVQELRCLDMKAIIFKHTQTSIYRIELWNQENKNNVFGRDRKELEKKARYGLIELGGDVKASILFSGELVKHLEREINTCRNINADCLDYLEKIGYIVYEIKMTYSEDMKEKGVYVGKFLVEEKMENADTE